MPVTINSYIETLMHPVERFRSLKGIKAMYDSQQRPVFVTKGDFVEFEALHEGAEYIMTCPLSGEFHDLRSAEAVNLRYNSNPHMGKWELFKSEMIVFDIFLRAIRADVLMQPKPKGYILGRWMRLMLLSEDRSPWRRLLKNLAGMAHSFIDGGLTHGCLTANNIIVNDESLTVAINSPLYVSSPNKKSDAFMLASTAASVYIAACEPSVALTMGTEKLLDRRTVSGHSKDIIVQAEFSRNRELKDIMEFLSRHPFLANHTKQAETEAAELIRRLSFAAFEPMPLLRDIIGHSEYLYMNPVVEDFAARICDKLTTYHADVKSPAKTKVNFSSCEYVGSVSDTLILIREGGQWGYADKSGCYAIMPCFDDAGDFYEGRAAVKTECGWGLIDRGGNFIMEPCYEIVEWYGRWNTAAACGNGAWELYDRSGMVFTSGRYDWIGECSEGIFVVRRESRYGYIRCDGTPLTDLRFDEAFAFRDGCGTAVLNGKTIRIRNTSIR